jgi:hypothetical protein
MIHPCSIAPASASGGDCLYMLSHDFRRAQPDEQFEPEQDHYEIVDLTEHKENVGQQVNRQNQISKDAQRNQLRPQRNPRIAYQTREYS